MIWRRRVHRQVCGVTTLLLLLLLSGLTASPPPRSTAGTGTQIVLLGTGTPGADPDRSGPATAVVVNGSAYLVDFGAGVVRRAKAAVIDKGIKALDPPNLRVAFVTHLHSDHTVGYPDLILTPWVMGRKVPLEVYGPKGITAMTEHVLAAYQEDIEIRTNVMGLGIGTLQPEAYKVNAHEIHPGVVYKDANVTVTAFPTKHAFTETYGYRFDTADRSIVISGDTNPAEATIDACHGCDILVHEVLTLGYLAKRQEFQAYAAKYHTTTPQLAQLAAKATPGLLILYHHSIAFRAGVDPRLSSPEELLNEVQSRYGGRVVVGRDLDVY